MRVIGIMGPLGAGKSTVAKLLVEKHGVHRMRMAGPLKQMLKDLLERRGIPLAEVERMIEGDMKQDPSPKLSGRSPRWAMQSLGTEWARKCISPNFWVECIVDQIESIRAVDPDVVIVIDDIRFPNEVKMIRDLGGEIWRVTGRSLEKPPALWKRILSVFLLGLYNPIHPSERGWRTVKPDVDLDNSFSQELLEFQTNEAFCKRTAGDAP